MEIYQVREHIEKIIAEIGKCRREIEVKGKEKAEAISNYDKQLKIAMVTLREEGKFPVTLIEKIAKGVCADHRYRLEVAMSGYTATISNLEALKASLNAFQSIYKHMD